MAKIQFTSFVRRINRRLSALASRFGKSSSIYQRYASEIDARIPNTNIRYNDKGVIQIAKPKSLEKKGFSQYIIEKRVEIPTASDITSKYREQYQQYASDVNQSMSLDDFVQTMINVKDTFNKYFDSSQILAKLNEKHQEEPIDDEVFNKGMESLYNFMSQREDGAERISYDDFVNLAKVIDVYGL